MISIFKITRQTKTLILSLVIIAAATFTAAYVYYSYKNSSEDPRIISTKKMLQEFDGLMAEKDFENCLHLLDSIMAVFQRVPGYDESFEPGIVFNNRASVYLSMALYEVSDSLERQALLNLARINLDTGIAIYHNWLGKYEKLGRQDLMNVAIPHFPPDEPAFKGRNYKAILDKRVDDLALAQKETIRRLSVSYTNRGIVQRHQYQQDEAVKSYIEAIKLWKDNYTARNNLNVLMGKPPKDRSIIDQLFPPEKNKF